MSAKTTLRASHDYERPLFYPGQVLPDSELTQLAEFSRSHIEAEVRRHGWGVVHGLLPFKLSDTRIAIGGGVVADQQGRLFAFTPKPDTAGGIRISTLLDAEIQREMTAPGAAEREFDLWLVIGVVEKGIALAHRATANSNPIAPEIKDRDTAGFRHKRGILTATLELRAPAVLDDKINERSKVFDDFLLEFNKPTDAASYEEMREPRSTALAKLHQAASELKEYDGVPIGRLRIKGGNGALTVAQIDWAQGRRNEANDGLPAHPGHINVAPLFDMTRQQAEGWLARRGIQPWKTVPLTQRRLTRRRWQVGFFPRWHGQLCPGDTATLYVAEDDRVVLIEKGPVISERLKALTEAVVILFAVLFITAAFLVARTGS